MYFELWDMRTRNLIEEFDTEAEALAYVREVLHTYGEEAASGYTLGWQDLEAKSGAAIAHGVALVQRALQMHPVAKPA
jgi:hypothetical protein